MKLSTKIEIYSTTLLESAGFFAKTGLVLVAFASAQPLFRLMEYLVINSAYGHAAWVGGLRLSDWKHGILSNGDFLAGWYYVIFYFGGFILWTTASFGSLYLFSYIGLRLRGQRLSDLKSKPKKKWRTLGGSDSAAR